MYFLNLAFIILKGFVIVLNNFILSELSFLHLFYLLFGYLAYFLLKFYEKRKKIYYSNLLKGTKEMLTEHILKYCFKNNFRILISIYFVSTSLFIYVLGIFSLRIQNIAFILDIKNLKTTIINLYYKLPISLFFINFILIILFFFLLIKILEMLKKNFLKIIIKLHIYFSKPKTWYHEKIDYLAFSTFVYRIQIFFNILGPKIGYFIYKDKEDEVDKFLQKYGNIFDFINIIVKFSINYGYFIILILLIIIDIFYNEMVLIYTFYYLPLMFLYSLYLNYCNFVLYRRPYGLISYVNRLFYGDVKFINDKLMFIDGLPYKIDEDFGNEFLTFELNNFMLK